MDALIVKRKPTHEPPGELKAAGEATSWEEFDVILADLADLLNEHEPYGLPGETLVQMLRWKIRGLNSLVGGKV